jgi:hypothetical protein
VSATDSLSEEAPPLRGLTACYSAAGGVELRGASRALMAFAELLASDALPGAYRLEVPPGASPAPYDLFLTAVRVERGEGATQVGLEERTLLISGARETLGLLAENIEWLAGQPGGGADTSVAPHLHVEYYPGHPFLSSDAEPLVVTLDI